MFELNVLINEQSNFLMEILSRFKAFKSFSEKHQQCEPTQYSRKYLMLTFLLNRKLY